MAYTFETEHSGTVQIVDETNTKFKLQGINGTTNDADAIIEGLTTMLDIVGWTLQDVTRIVNQNIIEE